MIENPIQPNKMFATPEHMDALRDYCDRFSGGEKIAAWTSACMAWNLAHKMVEEAMKGESK